MIARAKESLREQGVPFDPNVQVGGMIEIPAAVLAMGAFLRKLDFLSIGTNDLIQYTLAVDRSDDAVVASVRPAASGRAAADRASAIARRDEGARCRSPSAARWPAICS